MPIAEEKFMESKRKMQNAIANFYESCAPIDVDDAGFMDDINDAVKEATADRCAFEDWFE